MAKTTVPTINATKRDLSISPSQLRKVGTLPGVLYGKGIESMAVSLPFQSPLSTWDSDQPLQLLFLELSLLLS